jgi:hypothetical protein
VTPTQQLSKLRFLRDSLPHYSTSRSRKDGEMSRRMNYQASDGDRADEGESALSLAC